MLNGDIGNTKTMCEICWNITETPERPQWRRASVFSVNLEKFQNLFWCFYCWLWTSKCWLGMLQPHVETYPLWKLCPRKYLKGLFDILSVLLVRLLTYSKSFCSVLLNYITFIKKLYLFRKPNLPCRCHYRKFILTWFLSSTHYMLLVSFYTPWKH